MKFIKKYRLVLLVLLFGSLSFTSTALVAEYVISRPCPGWIGLPALLLSAVLLGVFAHYLIKLFIKLSKL